MTCSTFILQNDLQFFLASENRFLKSNVHTCTKVGALHRSVVGPSGSASAAEKVSEDISEDVSHVGSIKIETTESTGTATCSTLKSSMTKLIILSSLLRVT